MLPRTTGAWVVVGAAVVPAVEDGPAVVGGADVGEAVVVGRGGDDPTLALSMGTAIAVASALDILVVARVESRSRSGL